MLKSINFDPEMGRTSFRVARKSQSAFIKSTELRKNRRFSHGRKLWLIRVYDKFIIVA